MVDGAGKEHLFLHFYMDSAAPSVTTASISSWFDSDWNFSYQEAAHWIKTRTTHALDSARKSFAYLTGTPLPPPPTPARTSSERTEIGKSKAEGAWSFAGMFSSLKGKTRGLGGEADSERGIHVTGEVHADLVKVCIIILHNYTCIYAIVGREWYIPIQISPRGYPEYVQS